MTEADVERVMVAIKETANNHWSGFAFMEPNLAELLACAAIAAMPPPAERWRIENAAVKITLIFEPRADGGLRVWSFDVPGLALSGRDPVSVIGDISGALDGLIFPLEAGIFNGLWPLPEPPK